ncbi:MAG: hypothetical protein ABSB49_09135 [Polyangia bacterium]
MRCANCRKQIAGVGKPGISTIIPAGVAFIGCVAAMWSLTLGQTLLAGVSPSTGWAVGLGSLVLSSLLVRLALARRKCPGCGSTKMLDAMEEESLIASERFAADQKVEAEVRAALANERRDVGAGVRAEVEAELRAALAKEVEAKQAALEEKQAALEKTWRAREHELRSELVRELEGRIESDLRRRLEKEIRTALESELKRERAQAQPAQIDYEPTPRIEMRLPPEVERRAPASRLAHPPGGTPGPTLRARSFTTPSPVARATPTPTPVTRAATTPTPVTRTVATPTPMAPASAAPAAERAIPAQLSPAELPAERAAAREAEHPSIAQTSVSAAPEDAPGSGLPGDAPSSGGAPSPGDAPGPGEGHASAGAPRGWHSSGGPRVAGDVHARAQRRARVIVSDLSLYEKATLVKAAGAEDVSGAKKVLGALWRDAIRSYNDAVPADVRAATNYLEDELGRCLAELRRAQ